MDASTQQLAHRVGIFLAAGMVAVAFVFMIGVAWVQGDGQAREMVTLLQPSVLGALGGLLGLLGVNTVVNGIVAVKTAGTVQQIPAASVAPVPAPASVPVPVSVPVSVPVPVSVSSVPLAPVASAAASTGAAALTPAQVINGG